MSDEKTDRVSSKAERLYDILRDIGACVSGHDGIVFDDVAKLLQDAAAIHNEPCPRPSPPSASRLADLQQFHDWAAPQVIHHGKQRIQIDELLTHMEMMVRCPDPLCQECRERAVELLSRRDASTKKPVRTFDGDPDDRLCTGCGKTYEHHIAFDGEGNQNVCLPGETPAPLTEADIVPGREFIWMPNMPGARCRVRVVEIQRHPNGDVDVAAMLLENSAVSRKDDVCRNDMSRFLEACVRAPVSEGERHAE